MDNQLPYQYLLNHPFPQGSAILPFLYQVFVNAWVCSDLSRMMHLSILTVVPYYLSYDGLIRLDS